MDGVYCVCSYDSIEVLVGCIEIECVVIVLVVLLVSFLRHIQLRKSLSLVEVEEEDEKHLAAMLDLLCLTTVVLLGQVSYELVGATCKSYRQLKFV